MTGSTAKSGMDTNALPPEDIIFGRSAAMQPVRDLVRKIVTTDVPVLIQGENGTGKGLLAQYIHTRSLFCSGSFVKVNCAAIPGELLESELFGYEKGAFTHAKASKPGHVELADHGTLFLDEIADLDSKLQAKMLQLLQDGQFSRLGDNQERRVETRVICATNRDLQHEIKCGRFRHDLLYRINVITINLPGLRQRRDDIVMLAEYFRQQSNARFGREAPPFPVAIRETLANNEWRGNIRELENLVARYSILGNLDDVAQEEQSKLFAPSASRVSPNGNIPLKHITKQAVREMETNVIFKVLSENKWNRRKAAKILNISYRALIYKIQESGLSQRNGRKSPPRSVSGLETPAVQSD